MSTFYNAVTFNTAPTMSGANITSATIPLASLVGTGANPAASTQTWTGIKTFTAQPTTIFTTDPGSTVDWRYGYQAGNLLSGTTNSIAVGYQAAAVATTVSVSLGYKCAAASTSPTNSTFIGANIAGGSTANFVNSVIAGADVCLSAASGSYSGWAVCGYGAGAGLAAGVASVTLFGSGANCGTGFTFATALGAGATCTAANQIMMGTTAETVVSAGTNVGIGSANFVGSICINSTRTTVSGSTSGTAIFSQPLIGTSYKKVMIRCASLNGTASYTFPVAFLFTPQIVVASGTNALAATLITAGSGALSTTAVTVDGGVGSTGILILEGY